MAGKPTLTDITLCCVDCAQPALALRAMRLSLEHCDFAAALLLTDAPLHHLGITVHPIARLADAAAYSTFVLKQLPAHITTDFALVTQWDGHVIDGTCWDSAFRDYDYIGAPWPWRPAGQQVGNGGFSLRSRRLMTLLASTAFPRAHPEDSHIGVTWRPALEAMGLRFAPADLARRFSVEMDIDPAPSLGFHGLYNFWRCIPPTDLAATLALVPDAQMTGWQGQDLLLRYVALRRWAEATVTRARIEQAIGAPALEAALVAFLGAEQTAAALAASSRR